MNERKRQMKCKTERLVLGGRTVVLVARFSENARNSRTRTYRRVSNASWQRLSAVLGEPHVLEYTGMMVWRNV